MAKRWQRIKADPDLSYINNSQALSNQLCIAIAQLIDPEIKNQLLIPDLKDAEDSNGINVNHLELGQFILTSDGSQFIALPALFENAYKRIQLGEKSYYKIAVKSPNGDATITRSLNDIELKRIQAIPGVKQFETQAKEMLDSAAQTMLGVLQALRQALRRADTSDGKTDFEYEEGVDADRALIAFGQLYFNLPKSVKKQLDAISMAGNNRIEATSTPTLGSFINNRLLLRNVAKKNDNNHQIDAFYCLHLNGADLNKTIEVHHVVLGSLPVGANTSAQIFLDELTAAYDTVNKNLNQSQFRITVNANDNVLLGYINQATINDFIESILNNTFKTDSSCFIYLCELRSFFSELNIQEFQNSLDPMLDALLKQQITSATVKKQIKQLFWTITSSELNSKFDITPIYTGHKNYVINHQYISELIKQLAKLKKTDISIAQLKVNVPLIALLKLLNTDFSHKSIEYLNLALEEQKDLSNEDKQWVSYIATELLSNIWNPNDPTSVIERSLVSVPLTIVRKCLLDTVDKAKFNDLFSFLVRIQLTQQQLSEVLQDEFQYPNLRHYCNAESKKLLLGITNGSLKLEQTKEIDNAVLAIKDKYLAVEQLRSILNEVKSILSENFKFDILQQKLKELKTHIGAMQQQYTDIDVILENESNYFSSQDSILKKENIFIKNATTSEFEISNQLINYIFCKRKIEAIIQSVLSNSKNTDTSQAYENELKELCSQSFQQESLKKIATEVLATIPAADEIKTDLAGLIAIVGSVNQYTTDARFETIRSRHIEHEQLRATVVRFIGLNIKGLEKLKPTTTFNHDEAQPTASSYTANKEEDYIAKQRKVFESVIGTSRKITLEQGISTSIETLYDLKASLADGTIKLNNISQTFETIVTKKLIQPLEHLEKSTSLALKVKHWWNNIVNTFRSKAVDMQETTKSVYQTGVTFFSAATTKYSTVTKTVETNVQNAIPSQTRVASQIF